LVADGLKQCLPNDCLNHVLAAEGEGWFDVHKLGHTADVYVNSHSCSAKYFSAVHKPSMKLPQPASHPTKPSSRQKSGSNGGTASSSSDLPKHVNSRASNTPIRCWRCSQIGHSAVNCPYPRTDHSETGAPRLSNKPESAVSQAKVNHLKVDERSDRNTNSAGADSKFTIDHPPELRIPDRVFYRDMEDHFRKNIAGYTNYCSEFVETDFRPQNDEITPIHNDAASAAPADNLSVSHMCEPSQIVEVADQHSHGLARQTARGSEFDDNGEESSQSHIARESGMADEGTDNLPLQLSPLQFTKVMIKGLLNPVNSLKDSGSEACLVDKRLIAELGLLIQGHVVIKNVIGNAISADLITLQVKPCAESGHVNIAPYIPVVFATCELNDVDMILSPMILDQLSTLNEYDVTDQVTDSGQLVRDAVKQITVDAVTTRSQAKVMSELAEGDTPPSGTSADQESGQQTSGS